MHDGPVVLTRAVGNQVSSSRKEWIEVLPQMGEFKYRCHTHDWGQIERHQYERPKSISSAGWKPMYLPLGWGEKFGHLPGIGCDFPLTSEYHANTTIVCCSLYFALH